jgi:hypothetical protein
MTNQPEWQIAANIGDADPIASGEDGKFVFVDVTGVYDPELEIWECQVPWKEKSKWKRYRLILEPLFITPDGRVCDRCEKIYRPDNPHEEWFSDHLQSVAQSCGLKLIDLWTMLTSDDPVERAWGYNEIIMSYGAYEFDPYPDEFTADEAGERIDQHLKALKEYERG